MEFFQCVAYRHLMASVLREPSVTENELRRVVDALPTFVTLMSPDGELELANRQVLEYFGATLEELKSQPMASTFHPDDRAGVLAAWKRSVESGEPLDIEGDTAALTGSIAGFSCAGSPCETRRGTSSCGTFCKLMSMIGDGLEALLAGEKRLLEMVASGDSMPEILDRSVGSSKTRTAAVIAASFWSIRPARISNTGQHRAFPPVSLRRSSVDP